MAQPYRVARDFRGAARRNGRAISGRLRKGRGARKGAPPYHPPSLMGLRGAPQGARASIT